MEHFSVRDYYNDVSERTTNSSQCLLTGLVKLVLFRILTSSSFVVAVEVTLSSATTWLGL